MTKSPKLPTPFARQKSKSSIMPTIKKEKSESTAVKRKSTRLQDSNDISTILRSRKAKDKMSWSTVPTVAHDKVVGGGVCVRGSLNRIIDHLRESLDEKNIEAFQNTCFGHLLDAPKLQYQGQLVFLLLESLISKGNDRNTLSFLINDNVLEFGPVEFGSITGLKFNEAPLPPSTYTSNIHKDVFCSASFLTAQDVEDAFLNYAKKHKRRGSLVLKLALLHVVYGLLTNRDRKCKRIDINLMHYVNDLEVFNSYPWGRVAYDHLCYWMYVAASNVCRKRHDTSRPQTDVCGFSLVLQIWAFEVLPQLAVNCARRINSTSFPRLLRWSTDSYYQYKYLCTFFSTSPESVQPFVLVDDEKTKLVSAGVYLHRKSKSPKQFQESEDDCSPVSTRETKHRVVHGSPPMPSDEVFEQSMKIEIMKRQITVLNDMLAGAIKRIEDLECARKQCASRSTKNVIDHCYPSQNTNILLEVPILDAHTLNLTKACKPQKLSVHTDVNSPIINKINIDAHNLELEGNTNFGVSPDLHLYCDDSGISAQELWSVSCKAKSVRKKLFETNENGPDLQEDILNSSKMLNPIKGMFEKYIPVREYEWDVVKLFHNWWNAGRIMDRPPSIRLPTECLAVVSAEWFDHIYKSCGLLTNTHCDVLLNLLIIFYKKFPSQFQHDWSIVESFGWDALSSKDMDCIRERIEMYVDGSYPQQGGKAWHTVDRVYGIGLVDDNHWVLYMIVFSEQQIVVFDSLLSHTEKLEETFYYVCRNLPKLCHYGDVYRSKSIPVHKSDVWEISIYQQPPQQTNMSDCGIMAVKFLECLVSGVEMSAINPSRCSLYRQAFCYELFAMSDPL